MTDSEDNTDTTEDHVVNQTKREQAVPKIVEELIYMCTLFRNPFPKVVTLNTWVVKVWGEAEEVLGDTPQSERSRAKVRISLSILLNQR